MYLMEHYHYKYPRQSPRANNEQKERVEEGEGEIQGFNVFLHIYEVVYSLL